MCITEHWLNENQLNFSFDNYKLASCFVRKKASHGGSLIIVKTNVKTKERKDIDNFSVEEVAEISSVELENHIIICVYKPPSASFVMFESAMENVLNLISKSSKQIIVCGDFNVDLLASTSLSVRLRSLFNSYHLINIFLEPTRTSKTSATCLDNMFTNCKFLEKEQINCFNSDHCGQKLTLESTVEEHPNEFTYRPITDTRIDKFKDGIQRNLSHGQISMQDSNTAYNYIFDIILKQFNDTFKLRTISGSKSGKKFSEWATVGIFTSRNRLYELYSIREYNKDSSFIEYVKTYSKIFKKVCIAAKSLHLKSKVLSASNKSKAVWKVINTETGKRKSYNSQINIVHEGKLIDSDFEVADAFDDFFSNIASLTTKGLKSSSEQAAIWTRLNINKCEALFEFEQIDTQTFLKTFKLINLKKSEDLWGVSMAVINHIISTIAPYLTYVFNCCVKEGVFPDLMKLSKIVPLFKSGEKSNISNFRPISILPTLSKVFEKIMLNQLLEHFQNNDLLHSQQFGFRKGRSTTDAASEFIKYIYEMWNNSCDAIGIFCDLSKAFDCVEHRTLLLKLEHYGLTSNALNLISSYLSNRMQSVVINGTKSNGTEIKLGVPQGSILGPFLFLVYMNDLPCIVENNCKIVLFADDTSLIFQVDRKTMNFDYINDTLAKISNWFTVNNLLLNSNKTKCIRFALPNVKLASTVNIKLNDEYLELIDKTTFLGLTVDKNLQWSPHISSLAKKLSSAIYAIRKIRQLTDVETARLVYFSNFHNIMSYGILVWGKAADIQTIFVLQKRAIRAVYNMMPRDSLRDHFKEIDVLTMASQYIYENILYALKNIDSFTKMRSSRHKHKIAIPKFRIRKASKSFMGQCVCFYNKLPSEALDLPLPSLKKYLKSTLLKKAYYSVEEYIADKNAWPNLSNDENCY